MTDQEQKRDRFANEDEPKDEPDVEGHRHSLGRDDLGRGDLGRGDLGETDEPDVEAHRLDKFEPRHDA